MLIGFDTETHLIRPGHVAPRLVCGTLACDNRTPSGEDLADELERRLPPEHWLAWDAGSVSAAILDREGMMQAWPWLLQHHLVVHNASFDLQVMMAVCPGYVPATLEAVDSDRVYDTVHREKLIALAHDQMAHRVSAITGKFGPARFNLAELAARYLGMDLSEEKTDPQAWRLRYSELDGVPLTKWPQEAVDYAVMDAVFALLIARAQESAHQPEVAGWPTRTNESGPLPRFRGETREVRADLALQLGASWGLRTDGEQVTKTLEAWQEVADKGRATGERLGFVRVKGRDKGKPGSVDRKAMQTLIESAYAAQGLEAPRSKPSKTYPEGQTRWSEDVLEASGHEGLRAYAKCLQYTNFLNKYGDDSKNPLRAGVIRPITYRVSSLVRTGRTAVSKPPLQQPPREGGFRECFVPRPGYLFAAADYSTIELCALAQVHVWWELGDTMSTAIRDGRDLHVLMAVDILNAEGHAAPYGATWDYALGEACRSGHHGPEWTKVIKTYRQLSKAANFGLPGGLGATTFVGWARKTYGVQITLERAEQLKRIWLTRWPEMVAYFRIIGSYLEFSDRFTAAQPITGRIRGGCSYTSGCNTYFQGLVADGFKAAAWELAKRCYTPGSGPLAGARVVLPLHDEFVVEVPEDRAHEAAMELSEVMRATMQVHLPDVPVTVEPALMRRWYKDADPVWVNGRLVPWEPEVPEELTEAAA